MSFQDPYPELTNWAATYFSDGRTISRDQFEDVCCEFAYGFLLPVFRDQFARNRVGRNAPDRAWWAGLNALSRFWAKKIFAEVDSAELPRRIGFLDWGLVTYAELCKITGASEEPVDEDPFGFPLSWTRHRAFIAAWDRALREPKDNRLRAMLILALEWDTCWIPMRYFSDRAAVAYLNRFALRSAPQLITIKNYQEHWRGPRGLGLSRARNATVVELPDDGDEFTFRVDAEVSKRLGLNIREFSIGPKGGKPLLRFETV